MSTLRAILSSALTVAVATAAMAQDGAARNKIAGPHLSNKELYERWSERTPSKDAVRLVYQTSEADNQRNVGRLVRWTEIVIADTFASIREINSPDDTPDVPAVSSYVYDFALDRMYILNENTNAFVNVSLYSAVAAREQRFASRIRSIRARNRIEGTNLPASSLFWAQSEAGLTTKEYPLRLAETRRLENGGFEAYLDGELIATAQPSEDSWTRSERDVFVRLLRHHYRLHPSIVTLLNSLQTAPGQLFLVEKTDYSATYKQWALVDVDVIDNVQPLRRELEPGLTRNAGLTQDFIDNFADVMFGAANQAEEVGPPPTEDDFAVRMRAALDAGRPLAAALVFNEARSHFSNLQEKCGRQPDQHPICAMAFQAADQARALDETKILAQATALDRRGYHAGAVNVWRSLETVDDLDGGVMLDLAIARSAIDTISNADRAANDAVLEDPRRVARYRLLRALERSPYLPEIYREVGEYHRLGGDLVAAWISYDLGRSLPDRDVSADFSEIDALEESIRLRRRAFFLDE